jgi:hypothetical protein
LVMGAWCGFTTETTNDSDTTIPDTELGTWITTLSRSAKKKKHVGICSTCKSIYHRPPPDTGTRCAWCIAEWDKAALSILQNVADANAGGNWNTDTTTGEVFWTSEEPPPL